MSGSQLGYFGCQVSYFGSWINLNDGLNYRVATDPTLTSSQKTRRKIVATSPVLDGEYLLHATTAMVSEPVKVWVYGADFADLNSNILTLESVYDQYNYRMKWTWDTYVETWACQMSDITIERSQVYSHSIMAAVTAQVSRMPDATREEIF